MSKGTSVSKYISEKENVIETGWPRLICVIRCGYQDSKSQMDTSTYPYFHINTQSLPNPYIIIIPLHVENKPEGLLAQALGLD